MCKSLLKKASEGSTLGSSDMNFFFSCLCLRKRTQASNVCMHSDLCSDPDSQMYSLVSCGGTEAQFLGDSAREGPAPLPLVGGSGTCCGPETKKSRLGRRQSPSQFSQGEKKTIHSFVLGFLANWEARQRSWIIYSWCWLFSRVKPYRKVRETKGHASHWPNIFQRVSSTVLKGNSVDISTPNSWSQPAHIWFAVFDEVWNTVSEICWVRNSL